MEILFAPLEGVTYPEYRLIHSRMFPGVNQYFSPFIAPNGEGLFKAKYLERQLPDLLQHVDLVPQILANSVDAFNISAAAVHRLGYEEINLNAGCPSGTVFAKHKGSGMLTDLDSFARFLDGIFSQNDNISIKTRMGISSCDEFGEILSLYNRYPLSRLIIHTRARAGMYESTVDLPAFLAAFENCACPVTYNGDIFSPDDVARITKLVPDLGSIMIGRGAIANPALPRMILGGPPLAKEELRTFHDSLFEAYLSSGISGNFTVERMKNLWKYMGCLFPSGGKTLKELFKAKKPAEYLSVIDRLFTEEFLGTAAYKKSSI